MARYRGPKSRIARKFQEPIFGPDKALEKKNYPPGQHGPNRRRGKKSEYAEQLAEKQKAKYTYGILEKQFRLTYAKAAKKKGKTGENLLILLERRLDNIVYRMGFGRSLAEARQLVKHSHVMVNGKKCNIPSAVVKIEDVIEVRAKSKKISFIKESCEFASRKGIPAWLSVDQDKLNGKVVALPTREQISIPIQEQLIVELYSR